MSRQTLAELGIDVAAELRVLTDAVLQGSWQVPAELARWALRSGAERLELRLARRGIELRCPGAVVHRRLLEAVAAAPDGARPDEERHQALAEIESADAVSLLWLATRRDLELELPCDDGVVRRLAVAGKAAPRILRASSGASPRILARRIRLDPARARSWLRSVARFAPVPVELDGFPVGSRFPDGLFSLPLGGGLRGELCVTARGESPELWLLRHGLVAARATVPGYPPFHAAVEMADRVAPPASGAALREAVTPCLPRLIDAAIELFVRLGERAAELEDPVRRRISRLLLETAALGLRAGEVETARVIERCGAGLVSVAEVRDAVRRGRTRVTVATPGEPAPAGSLVLDAAERAALARLIPALISSPPPASAGRPEPRAWLRRRLRQGLELARRVVGRRLRRDQLEPEERRFLDGFANAWPGGPVLALRPGAGALPAPVVLGRAVLPRGSRAVREAIRRADADPAWLYPAAVGLVAGAVPPDALRDRWLKRRGLVDRSVEWV